MSSVNDPEITASLGSESFVNCSEMSIWTWSCRSLLIVTARQPPPSTRLNTLTLNNITYLLRIPYYDSLIISP